MHISSKIYSLCRSCQFHRWQIYFLCPQTLDKRKSFHSVALLLVGNEIIRQETQSFPKNWENRFARVILRNEEGMITRQSIDEQFIIFRVLYVSAWFEWCTIFVNCSWHFISIKLFILYELIILISSYYINTFFSIRTDILCIHDETCISSAFV